MMTKPTGVTDGDPYWTRTWPSSIALAALILTRPELVRGKRVADVGCGLGMAGMAAAFAGASEVVLLDREPLALRCALLSAAASGLRPASTMPGIPPSSASFKGPDAAAWQLLEPEPLSGWRQKPAVAATTSAAAASAGAASAAAVASSDAGKRASGAASGASTVSWAVRRVLAGMEAGMGGLGARVENGLGLEPAQDVSTQRVSASSGVTGSSGNLEMNEVHFQDSRFEGSVSELPGVCLSLAAATASGSSEIAAAAADQWGARSVAGSSAASASAKRAAGAAVASSAEVPAAAAAAGREAMAKASARAAAAAGQASAASGIGGTDQAVSVGSMGRPVDRDGADQTTGSTDQDVGIQGRTREDLAGADPGTLRLLGGAPREGRIGASAGGQAPPESRIRARTFDWTRFDLLEEKYDVLLACDVLYDKEAVQPISELVPWLLSLQPDSRLLLADPPNRTAPNRERLLQLLAERRLVLEERSQHECRAQQLDSEMVGGLAGSPDEERSIPVQLLLLRRVLGGDTVGLKL